MDRDSPDVSKGLRLDNDITRFGTSAKTMASNVAGHTTNSQGSFVHESVDVFSRSPLKDFQVQLMLLERQNRRRPEHARIASEAHALAVFGPGNVMSAAARPDSTASTSLQVNQSQQNLTSDETAAPTRQDMSHTSGESSRTVSPREMTPMSEDSQRDSNWGPPTLRLTGQTQEPQWKVIYQIDCDQFGSHVHPYKNYRDIPVRISSVAAALGDRMSTITIHLNGNNPIVNLTRFMQEEMEYTPFVLVRHVPCTCASDLKGSIEDDAWTTDLYMTSDCLFEAVQSVASYAINPTFRFNSEGAADFQRRYDSGFGNRILMDASLFLYHHRHHLAQKAEDDLDAAPDIQALLDYTRREYGRSFYQADQMFSRGLVNRDHLAKLFKPNDVVVGKKLDRPFAAVLIDRDEFAVTSGNIVCAWTWHPSGAAFMRRPTTELVMTHLPFERECVRITELSIIPLQHASTELVELLRAQGLKHWNSRHAGHVSYRGWNTANDRFYSDARFMIDDQMFQTKHPHLALPAPVQFKHPTSQFDKRPTRLDTQSNIALHLDPSLLLTFLPDIYGFDLAEKRWVNIFIEGVEPRKWDKRAFEQVLLAPEKKELVKALLMVQQIKQGATQGSHPVEKRGDLISDNKSGLTVLLQGSPGTGKTLTAESLAEIAEMPLFRVACGDVKINAADLGKYVKTIFHLCRAWNCMLLLEDANIFFQEHPESDIEQEALVSVFLNEIEHYDGVLILTSNRDGSFSEAFRSRIHVVIYFDVLSLASRESIWASFFDMLEEDGADAELTALRMRLPDLAEVELNGHQIRNVLAMARDLALYNKEALGWTHLKQALQASTGL